MTFKILRVAVSLLTIAVVFSLLFVVITISGCNQSSKEDVTVKDTQKVKTIQVIDRRTKEKYSPEQIEFIKRFGLSSSKTLSENLDIEIYKKDSILYKKYGVHFISDAVIKTLFLDKFLVMGGIENFTGIIPAKNIDELKSNLTSLEEKDSAKFKSFYFLRVSNDFYDDNKRGKFLEILNPNDVQNKNIVVSGAKLNNGQDAQFENEALTIEKTLSSLIKYGIKSKHLVVDRYEPEKVIIAPYYLFSNHGRDVIPADLERKETIRILIKITDGWLVLTSWK